MVCRFDCSPAAVSAAISVYADGSVLVTHGGIEMGQGLSTKVKQAAAAALSQLLPEEQRPLPLLLLRLAPSSSEVVPGGGPSWSSTASEGNCQAVMNAAAKVVAQMAPYAKVGADGLATWRDTLAAICPDVGFAPNAAMLSAYGWFDGSTGSGAAKQAVQYSAFGAALSEVELDVLTGERRVVASSILYDCGYPLNPGIDLGQVEGAFVMGLGIMLSEDVQVQPTTGKLLSDTTWKYKIPHYDLIPKNFTVSFLKDAPNPRGILSSKASGEPALMASTSALMALQAAAGAAAREVAGLAGAAAGVTAQAGMQQQQHQQQQQQQQSSGTESTGAYGGAGAGGGWCVLSAPATPVKLKAAVGSFSIADALEAALAACVVG
ncbi:hypothetical protein OEZ86_006460 [Tetradesmus obliquus]|nr:hypothetical protein OEZ86_006460 [Tetradesmus obliquus]